MLKGMDLNLILEWNYGNHFTVPEIRTAKDFIWCINQTDKGE